MVRTNGSMTLTFNSDIYGRLLAEYQPRPITTEEENERALTIVEYLMTMPKRSLETNALIEVWVALIEQFEEEYYPLPTTEGTPVQMLRFLMDQHGLKQSNLVDLLGSSGVVSEIVNGKRGISKAQARALAERFHVPLALFL